MKKDYDWLKRKTAVDCRNWKLRTHGRQLVDNLKQVNELFLTPQNRLYHFDKSYLQRRKVKLRSRFNYSEMENWLTL